jgi:hypothetical protein
MKKIVFIAAVLFTAVAAQAQIKFGVKAGANFYKFGGDDAKIGDISPKLKIGLAGGGIVNIPISEMFSVQPEVLYSMEGAKYEEDGEKLTYKTDYINIPVMIQYNNTSGFYAETGPQIGFLASAKGTDGDNTVDLKDQFKGINFSWALGLGYKMSSGFGFGARYNLGLGNILDDEDANIKLGGFNVGVFYMFGGSKK